MSECYQQGIENGVQYFYKLKTVTYHARAM